MCVNASSFLFHSLLLYFSHFFPPPSDILKMVVFRNVDRPELCQISLYDFQKFLQMDQKVLRKKQKNNNTQTQKALSKLACASFLSSNSCQESWASDLSRVREFLMGYMRGGHQPEPMLQLDEVTKYTNVHKDSNKTMHFPTLYIQIFFSLLFFPVPDLLVL